RCPASPRVVVRPPPPPGSWSGARIDAPACVLRRVPARAAPGRPENPAPAWRWKRRVSEPHPPNPVREPRRTGSSATRIARGRCIDMRGHTAGELLVERLIGCGVDTVFGLPGDGINGVMEGLRKHQDRIRFVHVRHEESAAFAACAY